LELGDQPRPRPRLHRRPSCGSDAAPDVTRWPVVGRTRNLTLDPARAPAISGDYTHRGEKFDCAVPQRRRPKKTASLYVWVAAESDVWRDRLVPDPRPHQLLLQPGPGETVRHATPRRRASMCSVRGSPSCFDPGEKRNAEHAAAPNGSSYPWPRHSVPRVGAGVAGGNSRLSLCGIRADCCETSWDGPMIASCSIAPSILIALYARHGLPAAGAIRASGGHWRREEAMMAPVLPPSTVRTDA
jgi:hypothetical protein